MVIEAQEEYVCVKCNRSWAIEPEAGYPREENFVAVGGSPELLRVNPKHVTCPFCGSREVVKCD